MKNRAVRTTWLARFRSPIIRDTVRNFFSIPFEGSPVGFEGDEFIRGG